MATHRKKPRDLNQLAKAIVDEATSELVNHETNGKVKNKAAVELGRLGGIKGGMARARRLGARKRSAIAKKAARARWGK